MEDGLPQASPQPFTVQDWFGVTHEKIIPKIEILYNGGIWIPCGCSPFSYIIENKFPAPWTSPAQAGSWERREISGKKLCLWVIFGDNFFKFSWFNAPQFCCG
jgi:hypothetical protein